MINKMEKVDFINLKRQYSNIKGEINEAVREVFDSTAFTGSKFVRPFEEKFAEAHDCKYCSCVNSGTSALHATLWSLGIGKGDEVILPVNTFIATAEAVSLTGAKPVFVDCESSYYNIDPSKIESVITKKTKAVIAVHLYGQPAEMDKIARITGQNNLFLIEDCAQAHLARYGNRSVGTFGNCGCFSFYPSKNLGSYGEGGAVITNDKDLYDMVNCLRDHGSAEKYYHDIIGHNYRMSGFQGAILKAKLKYLPVWIPQRRAVADLYRDYLSDVEHIVLPGEGENRKHTYHLFVIRAENRDKLAGFLKENQVGTGIHYPVPCHLQKAYSCLGYSRGDFPIAEQYADEVLSLPMFPEITKKEIIYVCDKIKEFYE